MLQVKIKDTLYPEAVAKAIEMCIDDQRLDRAMKVLEEAQSRLPMNLAAELKFYIVNHFSDIYLNIMIKDCGSQVSTLKDYEAVCMTAHKLAERSVVDSSPLKSAYDEYYELFPYNEE